MAVKSFTLTPSRDEKCSFFSIVERGRVAEVDEVGSAVLLERNDAFADVIVLDRWACGHGL
jgi:hypothetical protein